ncbi:MAG TPA: hypothetical protein PK847_04070 [Candidatus Sumerlaeota bacterium]|nr:hypothetical protein [Candidatus Sumerlaeota bacterium]HOR27373.1 hypothetical protein [Candidatus Sumerlaeota bacterium]
MSCRPSRRRALLACLGLILPLAFAAPAAAQSPVGLNRLQEGTSVVEQLDQFYVDGAGPFIAARAGDWRLANDRISLTFAGVGDLPATISLPVAGYRWNVDEDNRLPGALIDVATADMSLDFLGAFTQGIGLNGTDPILRYDTIEPVRGEGEVGLRLEGSPFETALVRLETIYWLAGGSSQVRLESRFLDLPADEPLPPLVDVTNWGAASMLAESLGPPKPGRVHRRAVEFYLGYWGELALGVTAPAGELDGVFVLRPSVSRVLAAPLPPEAAPQRGYESYLADAFTTATLPFDPMELDARWWEPAPNDRTLVRHLFVVHGAPNELVEAIQAFRGVETGAYEGQVTAADENGQPTPVADAEIRFTRLYQEDPGQRLRITAEEVYTIARTGADGRFRVEVPPGHYIPRAEVETRVNRGTLTSGRLEPGETQEVNFTLPGRSGIRVRAIDAATSAPLAARLRIESTPPAPPVDLGPPLRARGYYRTAYIPPAGGEIYLPNGRYYVAASHGIEYHRNEIEVWVENGKVASHVIPLDRASPTDGWTHVEIGARTDQTPGVEVTADDLVLMAAAEGLDWVITGDFEHLTDLTPALARLGLEGQLGLSRGFRTMLPARPDWGQFLVYPVAADAPDPAVAREAWADLTTAAEFIAALRRLYPGALIQCDLIYTKEGRGYFGEPNRNPYEISFTPKPEVETAIDAITLVRPRDPNQVMKDLIGFWTNHLITGRFYLPASSASGRIPLGAEPGYPRLLVHTGAAQDQLPSEAELFAAMRAHRVQLTTGPFVEYTLGDVGPGGLAPHDPAMAARTRVTAPNWADVTMARYAKEGNLQEFRQFHGNPEIGQRYPDPATGQRYAERTQKELGIRTDKDTLLNADTYAERTLGDYLPHYNLTGDTPSFALTFPIIIDADGDGVYDPLELYRQKGM